VITAGNGVGQPTGYASGGLGIQAVACAGNLDSLESLLSERIVAKMVNCWKLLTLTARTISSQASWKQVEGSETNAWNLSSLCGHGGKATRARCGLFKKEPKI